MVINIDPRRINTPVKGTAPARANVRREREQQEEAVADFSPKRVEENFIPEPESLATMIRGAVSALRKGLHWDRGTILNILV